MTTTTTTKKSEQTYMELQEINRKKLELNEQIMALEQRSKVLYNRYLDEQAEENAKEEMEAERQAKKAEARAKLDAEYAEKIAALDLEEDSRDMTYTPRHPYINNFKPFKGNSKPQGTFNEAAFMQEARDAELARQEAEDAKLAQALAAEEAANFRDWQQQQQQKASHGRHLPVFAEFLPEQQTQTQTSVKVHVEQTTTTTTTATFCGKEGCNNVWQKCSRKEEYNKNTIPGYQPRKLCDECLQVKHAQQAATRRPAEGDNLRTSSQPMFHTPPRSNPLRYGENSAWCSNK